MKVSKVANQKFHSEMEVRNILMRIESLMLKQRSKVRNISTRQRLANGTNILTTHMK